MSRRVAVVGGGVAGLVAAHVLAKHDHVTLYEADDRLGGHAHTQDVTVDGHRLCVDTAFLVHNDRTYPTVLRLFNELGVATQETDMSMSVRADAVGLEYAGGRGISGLVPSLRTIARPAYLGMLGEVSRFHRTARRLLDTPGPDPTLAEFCRRHRFRGRFLDWFLTPLVAAVWSCEPGLAGDYPARHLFTFLDHHGMLGVLGSPAWRTVTGGSREYVTRVAAGLAEVRTGAPVTRVVETPDAVRITANGVETAYDAVVIATHPPEALTMLADPTDAQRRVLGSFRYSRNPARLHTDASLLPRNPRARASWNYLIPDRERPGEVVISYDLTRLQRLSRAGETRLILTLGGADLIDPDSVLAEMTYEHPIFTREAVAAQRACATADTDRIGFAGAWQGWGFHEDGARSGLRAAERLGGRWIADHPAISPRQPVLPLIYDTTITHARREPVRHRFRHRSYTWLVDLDHLPDHGLLGRFEARDHIGDPATTIRDNVDAFLAAHDVDLRGGRILMLAQARVLGHCFNPLSVHWCYRPSGSVECVVVEVHNTYGDRHAYLVRTDDRGVASVDKALYVSPFNDVTGRYRLLLPEPGEELLVTVTLDRPGRPPFAATMRGTARHATWAQVRRVSWRRPLEPLVTAARIRAHGIWLWGRGVRIQDRPEHVDQSGTAPVDPRRWPDVATPPRGLRARLAGLVAAGLLRLLAARLDVRIDLPDRSLGRGRHRPGVPRLVIGRPDAMFARIGRDGLIGFGEAYQAGDWTAPDLAATLTVFARRMERLVPVPLQRLRGWYVARHPEDDRNTRSGSRTNIARHYDLSNDLFEAFLDRSMTYSAALFDADRLDGRAVWEELTPAQHAKIDRLLDLAHVGAGTQLLEIGTGWGELAIRAAQRGATVRSVTLSAEQRDLARVRARLAGVADRVTIDVGDYRDLTGRYDAVVSVEMIEAVGWEFLPGYFEQLERLLAPGGRIAVQAITMADHRMQATLDTYTWVHKYIFPGGMIPSPETIRDRAVAVGLTIVDDLAFGAHYTETLRLWEERFLNRWPRIAALGFDATFQRTWHFYLAYSRAGFASGYLDVHQYAMVRASDHRSLVDPGGC